MQITERPGSTGKFVVVEFEGKIIDESRFEFRDYFASAALNRRMVFDFAKVSYVDEVGLGWLVDIFTTILKAGGRMSIGNASQKILNKLTLTHLADVLGADPTLKGAVKKLRRPKIDLSPRKPKEPAYVQSAWKMSRVLQHSKCDQQFVWFGDSQPRFCPCCGRSTKK
jgi:anti-anti-sigma factor